MHKANGLKAHNPWRMIIDVDRCIGCFNCTVGCKTNRGVPLGKYRTRLSAGPYQGEYPKLKRKYFPLMCNQCEKPFCLEACPAKAIYANQAGLILIEKDQCFSCNSCSSACPYGAIYSNHETDGVAEKCDFCYERIAQSQRPHCVELCLGKAITLVQAKDLEQVKADKRVLWQKGAVVYLSDLEEYPWKWEERING